MNDPIMPSNEPPQKANINEFGESSPAPAAASANQQSKQQKGVEMGDMSLDMIMDVNVNVSVEVGRSRMSIRDLREMKQGAIIELDRAAGTPLDVRVNGTLVAKGEIVVVKEKYGIMLTEVVSQDERPRRQD
ncbi:flagellar motor switch protein FliN [Spongiibacter sp. IMCC21906]|uniref:flagellar motor switch protein FliN n=1 Tax=Spongiibacter sp. IMCC21906 TaxID=1620392 RepID=UPI00062DD353|nr:flagellar motor switch protein FliN [Spongiibacter sp. IMCC21906]AKH69390.1 flagellar motor switch protein FliN [Spongiibacter sp. IMCC21906]